MPSYSRTPAMQSHLETQINFMTELTRKSYDAIRKLSELNLQLAQQLMEDSTNAGRQMMSSRDPFQMSSVAFTQLQPITEHLRSFYLSHLTEMPSMAQLDCCHNTPKSSAPPSSPSPHTTRVRPTCASAVASCPPRRPTSTPSFPMSGAQQHEQRHRHPPR